jgi:hypothetical protein
MTGAAPRRRSRRDGNGEEVFGLVTGVAGALWRLRLELGLVAVVVFGHLLLSDLVGDVAAAGLLGALAGGLLAIAAVRRCLLVALRSAPTASCPVCARVV